VNKNKRISKILLVSGLLIGTTIIITGIAVNSNVQKSVNNANLLSTNKATLPIGKEEEKKIELTYYSQDWINTNGVQNSYPSNISAAGIEDLLEITSFVNLPSPVWSINIVKADNRTGEFCFEVRQYLRIYDTVSLEIDSVDPYYVRIAPPTEYLSPNDSINNNGYWWVLPNYIHLKKDTGNTVVNKPSQWATQNEAAVFIDAWNRENKTLIQLKDENISGNILGNNYFRFHISNGQKVPDNVEVININESQGWIELKWINKPANSSEITKFYGFNVYTKIATSTPDEKPNNGDTPQFLPLVGKPASLKCKIFNKDVIQNQIIDLEAPAIVEPPPAPPVAPRKNDLNINNKEVAADHLKVISPIIKGGFWGNEFNSKPLTDITVDDFIKPLKNADNSAANINKFIEAFTTNNENNNYLEFDQNIQFLSLEYLNKKVNEYNFLSRVRFTNMIVQPFNPEGTINIFFTYNLPTAPFFNNNNNNSISINLSGFKKNSDIGQPIIINWKNSLSPSITTSTSEEIVTEFNDLNLVSYIPPKIIEPPPGEGGGSYDPEWYVENNEAQKRFFEENFLPLTSYLKTKEYCLALEAKEQIFPERPSLLTAAIRFKDLFGHNKIFMIDYNVLPTNAETSTSYSFKFKTQEEFESQFKPSVLPPETSPTEATKSNSEITSYVSDQVLENIMASSYANEGILTGETAKLFFTSNGGNEFTQILKSNDDEGTLEIFITYPNYNGIKNKIFSQIFNGFGKNKLNKENISYNWISPDDIKSEFFLKNPNDINNAEVLQFLIEANPLSASKINKKTITIEVITPGQINGLQYPILNVSYSLNPNSGLENEQGSSVPKVFYTRISGFILQNDSNSTNKVIPEPEDNTVLYTIIGSISAFVIASVVIIIVLLLVRRRKRGLIDEIGN